MNSYPKEEIYFNLIIVGDVCVGKTSFVMQYMEEKFADNYLLTVGN
jgi:GTPase SAR1 family protein